MHKSGFIARALAEESRSGDFRRCYFGEILTCYRE